MTPRITVIGLGPAGPDLINTATLEAIESIPARFVRTSRHPSASVVAHARSFDHLYEAGSSLDDVYAAIVESLVSSAEGEGEVLYAVPGSPGVAERTVELLRSDSRVEARILPALSCLDLVWVRLGVDPLSSGVTVVDGQRFSVQAAGQAGPLLVLQCDRAEVLSSIKLAVDDLDHAADVSVLHHLGLEDESITTVPWAEMDRAIAPDHLTSLWIPSLSPAVGAELVRFAELVRTLRERCPWDRDQTHLTLTRHLLEETYEVLEAIEGLGRGTDGGWAHLEEELGDLLFQVYFHATLAAEEGQFTLADVARGIHDKLVRRHPHVFGDVDASTADAVVTNWEQIKRYEQVVGTDYDWSRLPPDLPS